MDIVEGRLSGGGAEVSMTDETSTPEPKAQLDTIGWLFVAAVAIITVVAVMAVYDGNDTMITKAPVSHVMASAG